MGGIAGEAPPAAAAFGDAGGPGLERLCDLQRHVRCLRAGTPLLLRRACGGRSGTPTAGGGREELEICKVWVSQDLTALCWQGLEGDSPEGEVQEVALSSIAAVAEDSPVQVVASGEDCEDHFALTVLLRRDMPTSASDPQPVAVMPLGLVFASAEDLRSWRDGLEFLCRGCPVGRFKAPAALRPLAAPPAAAEQCASAASEDSSAATLPTPERLEQQKVELAALRLENDALHDGVRSRDATIYDLQGSGMSRPELTAGVDEVAVLQRKNHRLQRDLRSKQQTVLELMRIVKRASAKQGVGGQRRSKDEDLPGLAALSQP